MHKAICTEPLCTDHISKGLTTMSILTYIYLCTRTYKIHTQTLYIYLSLLHSTAFQENTQREGSSSISLKFCGCALKVHVLQRYYVMIQSPWTASEAREIAPSIKTIKKNPNPNPNFGLWYPLMLCNTLLFCIKSRSSFADKQHIWLFLQPINHSSSSCLWIRSCMANVTLN